MLNLSEQVFATRVATVNISHKELLTGLSPQVKEAKEETLISQCVSSMLRGSGAHYSKPPEVVICTHEAASDPWAIEVLSTQTASGSPVPQDEFTFSLIPF